MADITNLESFLTDVASAIKQKTGKEEKIPAENFDTEILNIETGGTDISDATATQNDIRINTSAYIASGKVEGTLDFTGFEDYTNCKQLTDIILGSQRYDKLDYIQSNGGQFIKTDFFISDDDKIIITVGDVTSNDTPIISASTNWDTNTYLLTCYNKEFRWFYTGMQQYAVDMTLKHTIEVYRGSFKVNDNIISSDTSNKNVANKTYLKLFGQDTNNRLTSMKFYDLQLYRNDKLIAHFVPCKDKITEEAYLVDILTNKTYKNMLSLPFIAGNIIE